jgi:hypothetical protein
MLPSMRTYYRSPDLILKFQRLSRMDPGRAVTDALGKIYRLLLVSSSVFMYTRDLRW